MGNSHSFMIGANDDASTGAENHFIGSVKEIYVRAGAACPRMSAVKARHLFGGGIPPENADPGYPPELYCRLGTNDTYAEVTNRSETSAYDGTITGGSSADIVDDAIDHVIPRWSFDLDGTDKCISMGDVHDFTTGDAFSVSCWFKTDDNGSNQMLLAKRTSTNLGWATHYNTSTNRFQLSLKGTAALAAGWSDSSAKDGRWHHVVFTYDGSEDIAGCECYLDGRELTRSNLGNALAGSMATAAPLLIGGDNNATAPDDPFDGHICFVGLFDVALTSTEASECLFRPDLTMHSQAARLIGFWKCGAAGDSTSTVVDYGTDGNDGTPQNVVATDITVDSPKIPTLEYSTSFDGTNDCITLGDNFDRAYSDPWSISYWLKTSSATAHAPVSKMASGGAGYSVYHQPSSTKITVNLTNTATSDEIVRDFGSLSDLDDGEWHHYVVTYDGGGDTTDVKLYIDGVEKSGSGVTNTLSGSLTNAAPFLIGGRYSSSSPSDPVNGNMCGVSIWDDDLSSTEVSEIFKTGLPRDLRIHSARAADLESNYHVGQDDTYPTADDIEGSTDGTYTNMSGPANVEQYDAPVGFGAL